MLAAIDESDHSQGYYQADVDTDLETAPAEEPVRPSTAETLHGSQVDPPGMEGGVDYRPRTCANVGVTAKDAKTPPALALSRASLPRVPGSPSLAHAGRKLKLQLYSTWGDKYYIGLTGLQV